MENILEEINQIIEPLNNIVEIDSNNIAESINIKIKAKNHLLDIQEKINDELNSLNYEKINRLLDFEERNLESKKLGEPLTEELGTDDIDIKINELNNALKIIEDSLRLTEYNAQEKQPEIETIDGQNLTEKTKEISNLPYALENPTGDNTDKFINEYNNDLPTNQDLLEKPQNKNEIDSSKQNQELVSEDLPVVEGIPFEGNPVIEEFVENEINYLNNSLFIKENSNETIDDGLNKVSDDLQEYSLPIGTLLSEEVPNSTEIGISQTSEELEDGFIHDKTMDNGLIKASDESEEYSLPIDALFNKEVTNSTEIETSQTPEKLEDDFIHIEDLIKTSNSLNDNIKSLGVGKTELSDLMKEPFEIKIDYTKNDDPSSLNDVRDSYLNAIPNDLIDKENPIELHTQVTENGIIASSVDQLCEHIFSDVAKEIKKANKVRFSKKGDREITRYLSTKSKDSEKFSFIGDINTPVEFLYGDYINLDEFSSALIKYYNKNKGSTYIVTETNKIYSISESKLDKISKLVRNHRVLELAKSKKSTQNGTDIYIKGEYTKKFGKDPIANINTDTKEGYYVNYKDLMDILSEILKSKRKQSEWLKSFNENLMDKSSESKKK